MNQVLYRPVPALVDVYAGTDGSIISSEYGVLEQKLYCRDKYPQVYIPGQGQFDVHRLVAAAYLGEQPDGIHVRHADGMKINNVPGNFSYGTPRDNVRDAIEAGTHGAAMHSRKTRCDNGHEFTPGNTYTPSGTSWRLCRKCRSAADLRRKNRPGGRVHKFRPADAKRYEKKRRLFQSALIDQLLISPIPMSDRAIAKSVGVSHPTVARHRSRRAA